ncbi:MAG: Sensor protein [Marmoricola sp.]|nr:Sensor protein [Marmoricola sp.]
MFGSGGEMAARLSAHDWSATPLGPIDSWSPSLRTSVAIVLRSRYPMLLSWGEQLVMLYNDAFVPTLGTKHPGAVGGLLPEQFAEVWDEVGPMQRSVLAGGQATWDEDLRLSIERGTGLEEAFFTFSYSHVPDDEGPGGVLAVLTVTTDKVISARRLALLNELSVVANRATAPGQAMAAALEVLAGAERDLLGGALYSRSGDGPLSLTQLGTFGEVDAAHRLDVVEAARHPVMQALREHRPVTTDSGATAYPVTVHDRDVVDSVLVLLPHPLRPVDADHERFLQMLVDQVGRILAAGTARAREKARLEALAALDAAKTAFLSNVSHEFRTPLTLLLGPLEDVIDRRQQGIARDEVEVMHQSAHRLLRMVNALLDVARIEADGLQAHLEPTDLMQLTHDLLQPFANAASREGLQFAADLDPDLGVVLADPELWEKLLLNLVANAIKFTPEGSVRVSLGSRGADLVLRVTDTGTGIPVSDVAQVFDRFHRVPDSGGRSIEGTGIGLTLVAESAQAMGGSVTVESEVGTGSEFEVVLPLVRADKPASTRWHPHLREAQALADDLESYTKAAPDPSGVPSRRLGPGDAHILVVEDNPAMRQRLVRVLSSLGAVTTAPDGVAALGVLWASQVDLVVSDVMMPRLDGLALLREIRDDKQLRGTPVVLLSARAGSEAAADAVETGADDYVVKPFTSAELLARCRTTLELSDYRARAAASKERSALLAGVSHDMQTPLAVITTSLALLGENDLNDEDRRRIAERARVRASQLTRLVTQFLDWSRLSASQPLPIRLEDIDLAELLTEVASEYDGVLLSGVAGTEVIRCDRQRTEQILHNLVQNARRMARSRIEVGLGGDEQTCVVRVTDDGPGVAPEVVPHLFEAFGPTTAKGGNGLGLHVSREAAHAQGGELVLESSGPDGAVFALRLSRTLPG